MPRVKKDSERIGLNLDRETMERVRSYADEKGQTLTVCMERILKSYMDNVEKEKLAGEQKLL